MLQTIQQAVAGKQTLPQQVKAGVQAYINLLFMNRQLSTCYSSGHWCSAFVGRKRLEFRRQLTRLWQRLPDAAVADDAIPAQDTRHSAEFIAGGCDEIILGLLEVPNPEPFVQNAADDLTTLVLRAVGMPD